MPPKPTFPTAGHRPTGTGGAATFSQLVELEKRCAELRLALGVGAAPSVTEGLLDTKAYALIALYATDMLSVHASDGSYVFASPACERLFGWKPEDLLGRSAYDYIHPDDLAHVAADHSSLPHAPAERSPVEFRLRRPDGSYVWVETRSQPHLIDGQVHEIVCITRDVSERHAAAAAQARLIAELEKKIAEVKELKRLLPICAWCKSIRDDAGYWHEVDEYFGRHGKLEFTHGMCPSCAASFRSGSERPAKGMASSVPPPAGRRSSSRPPPPTADDED